MAVRGPHRTGARFVAIGSIPSLDPEASVLAHVPINVLDYDVTVQAIGVVGGRFSPRRRKQCNQPGCASRPGGIIAVAVLYLYVHAPLLAHSSAPVRAINAGLAR